MLPLQSCSRMFAVCIAVITGLVLIGCDSHGPRAADGKVIPRGRILQNGLPVKATGENLPPGDPGMSVRFIAIGGIDAGKEFLAQMGDEEDGSFELIGPDAKGIPPGKYRVEIFLAPEGGTDQFKGKYSRENSPIEVEIKEGEDLVIELSDYK